MHDLQYCTNIFQYRHCKEMTRVELCKKYFSLHFLEAFQPSRKDSAFVSRIVLQGAKLEVIVLHMPSQMTAKNSTCLKVLRVSLQGDVVPYQCQLMTPV